MRDNCVLKFSVKVNLKRLGGFLKLEIVYLHAHMCVFIWLTCRYFYRFCFAWSIKFLINFGFRLKHLVYVFIFVTSISNLFPITSKVMALWLKLKFSKYCGNLFFLNDIVVMSFKFLCDGFFMTLNGMLYFCYRQLVGHNH